MIDPIEQRVQTYRKKKDCEILRQLGLGTQGSVYLVNNLSQPIPLAVKFHERRSAYQRELSVYFRLQDLEINEVNGHRVPMLLGHEDELLTFEMTTVSLPFVLDFGGAYLDRRPDYSPEVWRDWREQKSEEFEENWPAVEEILAEFESFGIFIADVNPGNIKFD